MQFERFEWDENKRQINIEKHGIDFADKKHGDGLGEAQSNER